MEGGITWQFPYGEEPKVLHCHLSPHCACCETRHTEETATVTDIMQLQHTSYNHLLLQIITHSSSTQLFPNQSKAHSAVQLMMKTLFWFVELHYIISTILCTSTNQNQLEKNVNDLNK